MLITINLKAQVKFMPKQSMIDRFEETINNEDFADAKLFKENNIQSKNDFGNTIIISNQQSTINSSQLPNYIPVKNSFELKNSRLTLDVLDSIVYIKEDVLYKDNYTFNDDGNVISTIFHAEDAINGGWIIYGKYSYTYDADGNQLTIYAETYDTGTWTGFARLTNTYDSNGNLFVSIQEAVDDNGNWVNVTKKDYTYDEDNYTLSAIEHDWDVETETWVTGFGGFFTYDDMGNPTIAEYRYMQGSEWVIIFRYKYTYDDNYYLISVENNQYDPGNEIWLDYVISNYTNNEDGYPIEILDQFYSNSQWINMNKTFNTFDENGNKLTGIGQIWNGAEWENSGKQTFVYDDNNNFTSYFSQVWNLDNLEWDNNQLFTYTFTENGNLIDFISEAWDGSEWNLADVNFWFYINGTRYVYSGNELTAYYHLITSIIDANELKASVYPNPVTNGEINIILNLEASNDDISVILYSVSGKVVYSSIFKNTFGEYNITGLDHLEKGIYLLKVSNNSQNKVFKITF